MPRIERLSDDSLPKHTWPGAYPLFFFDRENATLCHECASKEDPENLIAMDVNWEDAKLECDECNKLIPTAVHTEEEQLEIACGKAEHFAADL